MNDMNTRSQERAGNWTPDRLRYSADPDRIRILIAQAASLGHEEAERWRVELALPELGPVEPRKSLKPLGHDALRLWACDCAERVLHLFERNHPSDLRPRKAIEVARRHAKGSATEEDRDSAADAAADAAAAASAAASAAAADAYAAEPLIGAIARAAQRKAQRLLAASYLWAEVIRG